MAFTDIMTPTRLNHIIIHDNIFDTHYVNVDGIHHIRRKNPSDREKNYEILQKPLDNRLSYELKSLQSA